MGIKKILEYLLDLVLPRSEKVRVLEEMSAEEFRAACQSRAALPLSPEKTLALFDYQKPLVRQAIWELKYRGNKKIAALLAQCLYEELAEELSERKTFGHFEKPLLVPVPLSKKRLRERGFNQCELLADVLKNLGGNFFEVRFDLLVKTKDTESQTSKNRARRLENLKGCFSVSRPEEVAGRNVIVLDDVVTTGATFEEARRTLQAAGARVMLAAVAH